MDTLTGGNGATAASLGYRLFDADNHYYEPEDAFLRYMDPNLAHKAPRWVQMDDGARRLIFGDRMNRFVGADHTFKQVGKAGVLQQGEAGTVVQSRANLEDAHADYTERDARLEVMDGQGLEASLLFPTLAVSVEALLVDDVEATYSNLHAFNLWLDDDWGFNYKDRIHGVALLSLLDPFRAIDELEFLVTRGAKVVQLRSGPVAGRSPADPIYDRFWTAVTEADVAVVFHASDDSYRWDMAEVWGWGNVNVPARRIPPLQRIIAGADRSIHDTIAALVYGKLFERFPTLRMATIELGSIWVPELLGNFERFGAGELAEHPIETFRRHFRVMPFEDEDIAGLADAIGTDRIMFGSDYPHTDGLADPVSFADQLEDFDEASTRKIMRDNLHAFLNPRNVLTEQKTMSTYVFVSGGWHGGWCWKRVADRLRARGHEVFTPTLTGLGERAHLLDPSVDLETHIADVIAVMDWEGLDDVVLVGHSYGGMVITAIADRAPERLALVVYLDALWPIDGESVGDIVGVEAAQTVTAAQSDPTSGSVIAGADQLARLLGVTDAEDVAWLASKLTPQPAASTIQPLKLQHAGATVDTLFVSCRATTFEGTELSYARAREYATTDARVRTVEIDAPHNVMVTHPDLLTEVLEGSTP